MEFFNDLLRSATVFTWVLPMLTFLAPLYRLVRGEGRYSDPFWALCFLGSMNRLAYPVHDGMAPFFSIALALSLAGFSVWYQREESPS